MVSSPALFRTLPQRLSVHGIWDAALTRTEFLELEQWLQSGLLKLDIIGPAFDNKAIDANSADPVVSSAIASLRRCYSVADGPMLKIMQYSRRKN